jgi:hypothetical protein
MKGQLKLLLVGLLLISIRVSAQSKQNTYCGFLECGYSLSLGGTFGISWEEINTIHGYQATPNLFIGAGVGFHFMPRFEKEIIDWRPYWKRDNGMEIPVFADFKWAMSNKKISPFVDLRLGHGVSNSSGLYGSIGFGGKYKLKGKQSVYALLSYSTHKLSFERAVVNSSSHDYEDIKESISAISLKVGFEF